MSDSQPLFVRLPRATAERLGRAAQQQGVSKRDIITRLVDDDVMLGHHAFHPAPEPAVLTAGEAAELLRVGEETVVALARAGELPGRLVAGEWRFGREALLAWLRCS